MYYQYSNPHILCKDEHRCPDGGARKVGRFCVPLGPRPPASEQPAFCPPLQANAACPLRPAPRPLLLPPTASTPHPRAGGSPARPLRTGKKPTVARSLPGPAGASATKAALRFRCGRAHHSPATSRQPPPPDGQPSPCQGGPPAARPRPHVRRCPAGSQVRLGSGPSPRPELRGPAPPAPPPPRTQEPPSGRASTGVGRGASGPHPPRRRG